MENKGLLLFLLFASYPGISITVTEWKAIWTRGKLVGLGRLFVLNLPIVITFNLILLGGKI